MPDPADPASLLSPIRKRSDWASDRYAETGTVRESADDVPVLLKAVGTALDLHRPVDRGRVMRCCEGCEAANGEFHEDCCHEWPCPTVAAIGAALAGEEATGA
jgi:hypothetical protein